MTEPKTLLQAIQYFSDPENCRKFMVFVRWPDGIVRCPRCGKEGAAYMEKSRLYYCKGGHEKPKFSLKVGTIFEESPIGLEKWLPAAWLIGNCKNGISSYEVARALGVTQKSAWFMLHRLREAMNGEAAHQLGGSDSGPVEIDETYVGGNRKNMHASRRLKLQRAMNDRAEKVIVMGMLDRDLRQVRAKVIPNVKRETLQAEILANVGRNSEIYTDALVGYDHLDKAEKDYVHQTVNHVTEYVRGEVHTNGIENFWSLLKRGLRGTYVAVEPFHLDRYVTEQIFRFNNRATKDNPVTDADRFVLLMTQVAGKRLTYAGLTGKEDQRPF